MMSKYILAILVFIFSITTLTAQQKAEKIEVIDMVKDLIVTQKEASNVKQSWWIPSEYWRIALSDAPNIGEDIILDIEEKLQGYSLFSIVNSDVTPLGRFEKKETSVAIVNGDTILSPLPEEEIPTDIMELINIFRPTLAGMVGQLGEQMIFYVFKNELDDGTIAISPFNAGRLNVKINDADFVYRLPLQSMVEKKVCTEDQELLNGNWEYCPWHGVKLTMQK